MRATHPLTRRRVFGSSRGSNPQTHLEPLSHASYASRRTGCVGRRHWTRVFISTSMIPASGSAPRSEAIRHARPLHHAPREEKKKEKKRATNEGLWANGYLLKEASIPQVTLRLVVEGLSTKR